jgi:probable rRNA maturation factor
VIEVQIDDARWVGFEALASRAADAVFDAVGLDRDVWLVSVLACDDARIQVLNADFREKDGATNVLSWPAQDLAAVGAGDKPDAPVPDPMGESELGDVAISFDTCAREAAEAACDFDDHVAHLMIHGTLHLLGYDHIRDADATLMETLEVQILGKLGLCDPYTV